jgi:opacity protein-like surface antigen
MSESRMFIFATRFALAVLLATLCLGAPAAHAQASPLSYWTPGWPMGFGGTDVDTTTYGNFPSFTAKDARGFTYQRFDLGNGWFMGNVSGTTSFGGIGQSAAFGNFGSVTTQGTQFGYNFKDNGLPISVFGGLDTTKFNSTGIGNPFTQFDSPNNSASGYTAHAGIEFRPTSNLSLSVSGSFSQQPDPNALVLPGASPFGPRR